MAADGHYYSLTWGGGALAIVYNKKLFDKVGIKETPRTTDELAVVCDKLMENGITPLTHYMNDAGTYWDYIQEVWQAQYDGMDYYRNNFYACKDEAGNSPSKDVLTKKDGRYQVLKAMEQFITPEYVLPGSNSQDHITMYVEFTATKDWGTRLDIAGAGEWQGITVRPSADGSTLSIGNIYDSATDGSIIINKGDTTVSKFTGNEFLLQLSFLFGEANGQNKADLEIGIYLNGIYYDTYIVTNCDMSAFGKYMKVYREAEQSIKLRSVGEEIPDTPDVPDVPTEPQQPNESLEKITFAHFNIKDGAYSYNGDIVAQGILKGHDTLDKTLICGDILLEGEGSYQLLFGGNAFLQAYEYYGLEKWIPLKNPIDIDTYSDKKEGDFGYLGQGFAASWDTQNIVWNSFKELGVDSVLVGHEHCNSASVVYDGIRCQFVQKSSTYDHINYIQNGEIISAACKNLTPVVGGTVFELSEEDGSIVNPHIYLCDEAD